MSVRFLVPQILSVYMSGSKNMSYDSASLTTPDIKWLGRHFHSRVQWCSLARTRRFAGSLPFPPQASGPLTWRSTTSQSSADWTYVRHLVMLTAGLVVAQQVVSCSSQMTKHDIATGKQLLEEDFIKSNPEWCDARPSFAYALTPPIHVSCVVRVQVRGA